MSLSRFCRLIWPSRIRLVRSGLLRIWPCALIACATAGAAPPLDTTVDNSQWPVYGGDAGGARFSDHKQIDRANVGNLKIAWQYRSGELGKGFARADKLAF